MTLLPFCLPSCNGLPFPFREELSFCRCLEHIVLIFLQAAGTLLVDADVSATSPIL